MWDRGIRWWPDRAELDRSPYRLLSVNSQRSQLSIESRDASPGWSKLSPDMHCAGISNRFLFGRLGVRDRTNFMVMAGYGSLKSRPTKQRGWIRKTRRRRKKRCSQNHCERVGMDLTLKATLSVRQRQRSLRRAPGAIDAISMRVDTMSPDAIASYSVEIERI